VVTRPTACPLDCPDACTLAVEVEGDRVVAIEGDRRNPLTAGIVCGKVRGFAKHMYGRERVLHPAVRVGKKGEGRFERVSWDEALALVADRMREAVGRHGGESILPLNYGGSNGVLSDGTVDLRLFHRIGASRLARTVCAAPSTRAAEGVYGKMPGVPLPDYEHAALIVIWGCNPHASGIHLVPIVQRARERGAKLVVVDPRRTPLAKQADLHLAVRPGTDLPVALAIAQWLFANDRADRAFLASHVCEVEAFERACSEWSLARAADVSGVPATQIAAFAELYASSSPAVIRCGWGPERNRNGGGGIAAILALPAIAGKLGVRGGGYTMSNSKAFALDARLAIAADAPNTRIVNMNQIGRALAPDTTPPISVLFVYDCNPLATLPNQALVREGLRREDLFTVVHEQVITDTARFADVVLPATTFLEHDELRASYGAIALVSARPVVAPFGEARPNYRVFAELCDRLGLARADDPCTPEALRAAVLEGSGLSMHKDALAHDGIATQDVPFCPLTPDGKIHLCPDALVRETAGALHRFRDDPATAAHPLALISPATAKQVSSTFGQLDRRPAAIVLHPDDAAARGLHDGDRVRVFNELGEVRCRVAVSDDVRPGVACLHKGLWSHHTENGLTANALCPDSLADLGGGATFNDARVQVEQIG
jgi:anaerobic selenocysteine-containing dehydrogenase